MICLIGPSAARATVESPSSGYLDVLPSHNCWCCLPGQWLLIVLFMHLLFARIATILVSSISHVIFTWHDSDVPHDLQRFSSSWCVSSFIEPIMKPVNRESHLTSPRWWRHSGATGRFIFLCESFSSILSVIRIYWLGKSGTLVCSACDNLVSWYWM